MHYNIVIIFIFKPLRLGVLAVKKTTRTNNSITTKYLYLHPQQIKLLNYVIFQKQKITNSIIFNYSRHCVVDANSSVCYWGCFK